MSPTMRLRPDTSDRACVLGKYFSSSMAWRTRRAVPGLTGRLFMVRETVAVETPARFATCRISMVFPWAGHLVVGSSLLPYFRRKSEWRWVAKEIYLLLG